MERNVTGQMTYRLAQAVWDQPSRVLFARCDLADKLPLRDLIGPEEMVWFVGNLKRRRDENESESAQ